MIRNCLLLAIVLLFSMVGGLAALEIFSWRASPVTEPCIVLCFVEPDASVSCSSTCVEPREEAEERGDDR